MSCVSYKSLAVRVVIVKLFVIPQSPLKFATYICTIIRIITRGGAFVAIDKNCQVLCPLPKTCTSQIHLL